VPADGTSAASGPLAPAQPALAAPAGLPALASAPAGPPALASAPAGPPALASAPAQAELPPPSAPAPAELPPPANGAADGGAPPRPTRRRVAASARGKQPAE
jgi:hypothetical protein